MSASLLATSLGNASGWRLMGLMRRGALSFFVVGGWLARKPGHPVNVTVTAHTVTACEEMRPQKNVAAVTGFFSLPPPFTAVAGTWDDIFLYFGSICCQLLIIPSAGWEEENCMSTSKWATTPAVVISEGEG